MSFAFRFRLWRIRWSHWEFWPFWAGVLPVAFSYLWFAARSRRWFFFSAANPAIPLGGAFGESKTDILKKIPASVLPKTVFAPAGISLKNLLEKMAAEGLTFPVIAKPDVGERGFLVKKIHAPAELGRHLAENPADFIVQEFLNEPLEMALLFYRMPGDDGHFTLTSLCQKEFLSVTGDGRSTVGELMRRDKRAAFQLARFEQEKTGLLRQIPKPGERLPLETIGNHCRGAKFVNVNHLIDRDMTAAFEPLCRRLDGIFYGRFDLKCDSVEALRRGECKVMELNGVLSDPAHVFDPAYGMWRAYRDYFRHWRIIYRISRANRRAGFAEPTFREVRAAARAYFAAKKPGDRVATAKPAADPAALFPATD